ncbi:MAG: peptidylprolyl isomerase [Candidatus Rokubacteria bacterium]|nr:peptidylprolyl isomerase [Candidatus Rokubacteria bacterium]
MTSRLGLAVVLVPLLVSGCAVPRWVPFLGKSAERTPAARAPIGAAAGDPARVERPPDRREPPVADGLIADRIVAVVNNDAITWGELLEAIAVYRQENRQRPGPGDDELARQFLNRMIDTRLQLQEAKDIVVDDAEVAEELADIMKRVGVHSEEELHAMLRAQGFSMDALRKRTRERIRVAKVVRRKVTMRISVMEAEIDRYLEQNRAKLETGLTYHARHLLVLPEGASDAAWERARERAEALYGELVRGADFAELARKHSGDATAKDGGDLGTLKRGELAQDVEAQIVALGRGEVSRPYRSPLGWHIFRLEEKEALEGDALQRVRQQIREILMRDKYEARLDAWLKELKQRAIIEVRL